MAKSPGFRANVGIIVMNAEREVAAFERSGQPGAWQLPQGGLDAGEAPLEAAHRELMEETGISPDDVTLVGAHPRWLAYELPENLKRKNWMGQVQRWFLFQLDADIVIDLSRAKDDEFSAHRWMAMRDLIDIVWQVRRPIYEEVARHFDL